MFPLIFLNLPFFHRRHLASRCKCFPSPASRIILIPSTYRFRQNKKRERKKKTEYLSNIFSETMSHINFIGIRWFTLGDGLPVRILSNLVIGIRWKYSTLFLRIKLLRRISVIVGILEREGEKKNKHGHVFFQWLFLVCNFIFGIVQLHPQRVRSLAQMQQRSFTM